MTYDSEQCYEQHPFHGWAEATKDFLFEPEADDPLDLSDNLLRCWKLEKLWELICRMVTKRFYQLPEAMWATHECDEWINEMMLVVMEKLNPKYDVSKGVPYPKYITERIPLRLADYLRTVRRHETVTHHQVEQARKVLKQEDGREPMPEQIATRLECEVWAVLEASQQSRGVALEDLPPEAECSSSSPHDDFLKQQLRACIDALGPTDKELFVRHALDGEHLTDLLQEFSQIDGLQTIKKLRQHYRRLFERIKTCVQ